jgi:GGDEF domain-containing protein
MAHTQDTYTDKLTGLGNKAAWERALGATASAIRARDVFGYVVLSVEVDEPTDERVCKVASAFRASIRATDVVCRMGRSHFLALLPDALDEDASQVAARVAATTGVSVGSAAFDGDWDATIRTAEASRQAVLAGVAA